MSDSPQKEHCTRCGIIREVRPGRSSTGLCRDCKSVLSTSEILAWVS